MQWVLLSGGGVAEAVRTRNSEKQVRGLYPQGHQEEEGAVPTSQAASKILTKFLLAPPPAEAEGVQGYCT